MAMKTTLNFGATFIKGSAVEQQIEEELKVGIPVERADKSIVEVVRNDEGRVIEIRYPNGSIRELRYSQDGSLNYMKSYPAQVFIRAEPASNWTDANGRQWNVKDISVNLDGDITFDTMTFKEVRTIDGRIELRFPNGTSLIGRDFEGRAFLDKTIYAGNDAENAGTEADTVTVREFGYDAAGLLNFLKEPSGRVWKRDAKVDKHGIADWKSERGDVWRGKIVADLFTTEVRAYRYVDGVIATASGTSIIREQESGEHDDVILL